MSANMCAVYNCYNSYKNRLPGVTFHRFPKSVAMRKKWVQLCNRDENFNNSNGRICSEHFLEEDFKRDLRNELLGLPIKKQLKEVALPSQKLCEMEPNKFKLAVDGNHTFLSGRKPVIISNLSCNVQIVKKNTILPSQGKDNSVDIQSSIDESEFEVNQGSENFIENEDTNASQKVHSSLFSPTYEELYKELLEKHDKLKWKNILLKKKLQYKNKQIKLLHDQLRYYKNSKYKKSVKIS